MNGQTSNGTSPLSEAVETLLDVLSDFSNDGLREKADFAQLLQVAHDNAKEAIIGDLAFTGKYLYRLFGTMRKQGIKSEHYDKLEGEFSTTVHEFQTKLEELIASAPQHFQEMIRRHYLSVSQPSLKHLMNIVHDFSVLKDWELTVNEAEQRER